MEWSDEEVVILKNNYPTIGAAGCNSLLPARTVYAIKRKARLLGVFMDNQCRKTLSITIMNKMRESNNNFIGSKNPNYKGGISKNNYHYKLKSIRKHERKHKCRELFTAALRSGKLQKQPCSVCGSLKAEGHHTDYDKPFSVVWLCRKHHIEADKLRRILDDLGVTTNPAGVKGQPSDAGKRPIKTRGILPLMVT